MTVRISCPAGAVLLAALALGTAAAGRPHIVFVLADDYGWGNFGWHRANVESPDAKQARAEVHTANMDKLVKDGILLDRHYAYKICSPSRSSLQSGRLAVHVNSVNTGVTVRNTSDPVSGYAGIPRNMTGMAQKLREAGYRTHMVGKWDAGMATPEHTPLGRGYESWVGYFQHANDYWTKGMPLEATGEIDNCLNRFTDLFMHNSTYKGGVLEDREMCAKNPQHDPACYEEYRFAQQALRVVAEHDTSKPGAPLFLFYAFHLLHTPLQIPDSYLERIDRLVAASSGQPIESQNRRLYAAMVLYMDEAIGNLVKALQARDMWKDTLLIFSADNGGPIYEPGAANNHPLKGGKYTDWEGGVRTNAFISGGFVPTARRGTSFEGVISIADWYGTLCEIAGTSAEDHAAAAANTWLEQRGLPPLRPVDSVAQWAFILNDTNARNDSLHLSEQALLQWPYKLITGKQPYSTWQGELYPNCTTIDGFYANKGPSFIDLKVMDQIVQAGRTPEEQDQLTWADSCGSGCLFNVQADPTEHEDLAGQPDFAEKLAYMQRELHRLNKNNFQPLRGMPSLTACEAAIGNGGFYGPFVDAEGWYSERPMPSMKQQLEDLALKQLLKVVNTEAAEKNAADLGQLLTPFYSRINNQKLDKCLTPGTDSGLTSLYV